MQGNPVVLYITLGFMLVFFFIWLWQSITNRRKLEDEISEEKERREGGEDAQSDSKE